MQILTLVTLLLCVYTVPGIPCCEHNGNTKPCTRCVKSKDKSGTNIILLAPHGGVSRPDDMTDRPDRGCYDSATGTCTYTLNCTTDDESKCNVFKTGDSNTIQLSKRIYRKIHDLLGFYPKRLFSNVKRSILDMNREVGEGTFMDPFAVTLYNKYHNKIQQWVNKCIAEERNCITIDVHGYASSATKVTQLGMGLSGSKLKLDDTAIQQYVNMSSIRRLSGYSSPMFPSLLRGNKSLGWYMQNQSLDALPSPIFPSPEGGYTYFGATKSPITIQYSTDSSDVIQAECHSDNRLTKKSRNIFGNKFAEAIVDFYNEHYGDNAWICKGSFMQMSGDRSKH